MSHEKKRSDLRLSRRAWLKGLGAAGIASLLAPGGAGGQAAGTVSEKGDGQHQRVPTRPFGKTGVSVSMLSLGGMFDIPSNQLLLKQALDWGVTYWDTADCYGGGKSEEGMGKFFSRVPGSREKVFLVSKSDARDPDGMTRLLNRSLERLHTNTIDLYFIHGLSHINELNRDTRQWVEHAKSQGKIRFFGFSTHKNMDECLIKAAQLGWIDGIMMTYNYRLMHTEEMKRAVQACVEAGVGLTAMKTQGGGPVRMESEAELKLAGRFVKQGFTDKQAKLKAVWENPHIASICSQMPNMTILMSNVAAALDKAGLSSADQRALEEYDRETAFTYCAGCSRICESLVAGEIPIGDIMRDMMYYRHYGVDDEARQCLATLSPEMCHRLLTSDFSSAEKGCPRKVAIGTIMKEAVTVLG